VVGDNVMIEAGNILAGGVRVAHNVRLDLGAIRF
jgi:acetyltransferase-like isoleucine patch superfamily enzyme